MKKSIFLAAILAVCAVATATAQPRAVGARLGWNLEASYQHSVGDKNFVEVDAGLIGYGWGLQATAIYDWVWLSPNWTPRGTWNWYAGVGGTVGYSWPAAAYSGTHSVIAGAACNVGLEYQFWFPLTLSFDYRPTLGAVIATNPTAHVSAANFYVGGLYDFALSVRYAF